MKKYISLFGILTLSLIAFSPTFAQSTDNTCYQTFTGASAGCGNNSSYSSNTSSYSSSNSSNSTVTMSDASRQALILTLTQVLLQLQAQLQALLAQRAITTSNNLLSIELKADGNTASTTIQNGHTTTLSWNASGAINCTISSNPIDTALSGSWSSKLQTSGTLPLSPTRNTTYSVTCYNNVGTSVFSSVNINVIK